MSGCGARTAAGSLDAVFGSSDVGAFRLDFDGDLGGEAEETALFLPVMWQVLTQPQQPARRQLDGMSASEESGGVLMEVLDGEAENRRCSLQSCGRSLLSRKSRVGVSSIG